MRKLSAFLLAGFVCCLGCSKPSAPQPIALDQIPNTVDTAFKGATEEIKTAATGFTASVRNNDLPGAFEQLTDLTSRPDLTPEQRGIAARAMMSVAQNMREAAAKGDQKAAEQLSRYQSSR